MEVKDFIAQSLDSNWNMVQKAVEGLTPEELSKCPTDQCNSIGWLMWHTARAEDELINGSIQQKPQAWTEEGWCKRCGMESKPQDDGYKHTSEQLAAFKVPDLEILKGYWSAVRNNTKAYLNSLKPADLERQIPAMTGDGTSSVGEYLSLILDEVLVHGGQIAYLRGMHRGMGWWA